MRFITDDNSFAILIAENEVQAEMLREFYQKNHGSWTIDAPNYEDVEYDNYQEAYEAAYNNCKAIGYDRYSVILKCNGKPCDKVTCRMTIC